MPTVSAGGAVGGSGIRAVCGDNDFSGFVSATTPMISVTVLVTGLELSRLGCAEAVEGGDVEVIIIRDAGAGINVFGVEFRVRGVLSLGDGFHGLGRVPPILSCVVTFCGRSKNEHVFRQEKTPHIVAIFTADTTYSIMKA